jgi:hypothetical protein
VRPDIIITTTTIDRAVGACDMGSTGDYLFCFLSYGSQRFVAGS